MDFWVPGIILYSILISQSPDGHQLKLDDRIPKSTSWAFKSHSERVADKM